ncbi:hypothetical protein [uncultured Vibrio sp.]|nr:hypothetical protein [uncultured Vibrio sp.]
MSLSKTTPSNDDGMMPSREGIELNYYIGRSAELKKEKWGQF